MTNLVVLALDIAKQFKTCRSCGTEKLLVDFRANRNMADGHLSKCRACESEIRRSRRQALTAEVLRTHLHYDSETGLFTRLRPASTAAAGEVAGYENDQGYIVIAVCGAQHHAHRLAWLYMTSEWPSHQVDHRNLDKGDNRWANLRLATPSQNGQNAPAKSNNTSSCKGVSWYAAGRKWRARIVIDKREISLGYFDDFEAAKAAYEAAAIKHFGAFARLA